MLDPEPDTLVPEDPLANLYAPPEGHVERAEPAATAPAAVDIEPQPYISEQFEVEKAVSQPATAKTKGSSRSVFIVAGLIILLGAAAGFIWVVYYLFFAARPE